MEPDNLEQGIGRLVPMYWYKGGWRLEKGYRRPDYVPSMECNAQRYGVALENQFVCTDLDPKNNEDVFSEMRPVLTESMHRPSKSLGAHLVYEVPEHLRGKIKERPYRHVKGVDIKTFIFSGEDYGEWQGEIKPLPQDLVEYFEKELENTTKAPEAPIASEHSNSLADDYMRMVEPEQEYFDWLKQVDALIGCGGNVGSVLSWCSTGAKYDRNTDSRIVEHSACKKIAVGAGWLVWDFRRKNLDSNAWLGPRREASSSPFFDSSSDSSSDENEQWLMSKRWNRKEHITKQARMFHAGAAFFQRNQSIEDIAAFLKVDEKRVVRYLHQYLRCIDGTVSRGGMTMYRTRLAQNGTPFFDVCRDLKKGNGVRATARKRKVPKSTVSRWFQIFKANPFLALSDFALRRLEQREEKKRKAAIKASKPKKYINAVVNESIRLSNGAFKWSKRTVKGWFDGDRLEIAGERTRTGKQKTKMARTIERYKVIEPPLVPQPLRFLPA